MKALLLSGFLVLLAATTASARIAADLPWVCGPREVFKECVSSTCAELKCGMEGMPEACTMDCASGCFCAPGFYRRGHRECVRRSECQIEPLKPMPKA
uniref:Putative serine proteinase inhibitor n=1 Tax=Ixodes scapularis TaxID=6945 RepID=A0A4D5S1V5_IXOSC